MNHGSDIIGFMFLKGPGVQKGKSKAQGDQREGAEVVQVRDDDSWAWAGEVDVFTQRDLKIEFIRHSEMSLIPAL